MKVILVMALTADGKIGRGPEDFPDWTGREDKRRFKEVTLAAGVVIMGSKTYDVIGKPLPGRKNIVLTRKAQRWSSSQSLVFTGESPEELLAGLERQGYQTVVLAGGATINSIFAEKNLIDEIQITYVPLIFGAGLSLFDGKIDMKLELKSHRELGTGHLLAEYRVIKSERR